MYLYIDVATHCVAYATGFFCSADHSKLILTFMSTLVSEVFIVSLCVLLRHTHTYTLDCLQPLVAKACLVTIEMLHT